MKLKALVALVVLGLAGASLAYAAPQAVSKKPNPQTSTGTTTNENNGKKPKTTGENCKPKVVVILKGTYDGIGTVTVNNVEMTYLAVHVNGGNRFAKPYRFKVTNTDTNVYVDSSTKYKGPGHHAVGDLKVGDRLVIRAPVCKADVKGDKTPDLTAKRVLAHTPKSQS
ncbi:MAG TPA: hypothetical protein VNH40_02330 [Gaiellaceae bacterium]|nr:hypothetical protein [Gaiellaceae bacterium]